MYQDEEVTGRRPTLAGFARLISHIWNVQNVAFRDVVWEGRDSALRELFPFNLH